MKRAPHQWTRRTALAAAAAAAFARPGYGEELPWQLPKLRRVRVHNHHMAYFEAGTGSPLVLVHGASGSPAMEFGRVFNALARKFRVLAPYLIGWAPSDQPDLPYDAATFVDYLGEFLSAQQVEGAVLAGESLGGWVVGQYALHQGKKSSWGKPLPAISHLVIIDGAVQIHPGEGGRGAQDSINDPQVAQLTHDFYVAQPKVDNSKVAKAAGQHVFAQQLSDAQLKSIAMPTLVLWGQEDKLLPVETGRHVAAQIPEARLVIIKDCGHIPSIEQPRAFLSALGDFTGVGLSG